MKNGELAISYLEKRELIAAMIMQAFSTDCDIHYAGRMAKVAVEFADALLAELEKEKTK